MTLKTAIDILMYNDNNATWDEVQSMTELKESLIEAMTRYHETEETYIFYSNIYNSL